MKRILKHAQMLSTLSTHLQIFSFTKFRLVQSVVAKTCSLGFGNGHKAIFSVLCKYVYLFPSDHTLKWLFQGEYVREYGSLWSKHLDTFFWTDGVIQKSRNYDPHQSVKGSCFSTSVFLEWLKVSPGWVQIIKHIALKKCATLEICATTRICQASAWPSIVMTCWIEVHSCHRCLAKLGETAGLFSIPFQPHEGGGWKSLPPPGIQEPKHPPATIMVQMQLWD